MTDIGRRVYGAAAILLGLVGLVFADFAAVWQPVPPETPGRTALAYATALAFLLGGAALQWRRSARIAAIGLGALHAVFMLLWARRVVGHPAILGTWSGTAEQLAIVLGAVVAYAGLSPAGSPRAAKLGLAGRIAFGVCLLIFGAAHMVYVKETAALVPAWTPGGQKAWALITGAAHIAGGLALISGVLAPLASRLVTAMFVVFGVLVWLPQIFNHPSDHMAWAGNGINLALIGAAWIVADSLARRRAAGSP